MRDSLKNNYTRDVRLLSCWRVHLLILSLGLCIPISATAQLDEYKVKAVKAVYLEKLTRFIEWPKSSGMSDTSTPFVVAVIGENPFGSILEKAYAKQKVKNKKEGNYSIRVQKRGNDETGLLYDGFNSMLEQIQDREMERARAEETLRKSNEQLQQEIAERKRAEQELARYHEHLEELVGTRTIELTNTNRQLQQEIEERQRAEEERESLRRLSQRLTGPLSVKEVGRTVAEESRRLFGHDAFILDLFDESTQKLLGIHYEDTPPGAEEPEEVPDLQEYATPRERDILAGKSKLINRDRDPTDTQRISFGYESRVSSSLMFVPIRWENRSIGILSVQSYTPDRYSERELELLQTFADQCGGALVQVRAQEALRESERGLAEAQRIAHLGNWHWNIITNELFWSDETYRIFGLEPQEFGATYDAFLNSVHPDDRESVKEAVVRSLADPNVSYDIEHRVVQPTGSERVVHEQSEVIFDDTGRPIRMVGTVLDITVRVRAEEERESLQRLSQRLTGQMLDVNEVGRIVAEESRRLFDHDAFTLDLFDASTGKLSGVYYEDTPLGAEEPVGVPTFETYASPRELNVLGGKPQLISRDEDAEGKQMMPFGDESRHSRSMMFVPIRMDRNAEGRISEGEHQAIGLLSLQSYTSGRYGERDLQLLQTFADQCGGAVIRVRTEQELRWTHAQLVQSEKMASLGMLVAGVAHEINTPLGAISSMHDTLRRAMERLKSTLDTRADGEVDGVPNVDKLFKIIEDGNRVIFSGTERVKSIVRRLRSFARLDEAELKKVDIHEGIEDTLTIVHHELKHKAEVERNFGDIPPIACYPGRLNQVFLNLLMNAGQAIEEEGTITITTFQRDNQVHIGITDTGVGISEDLRGRIFDPGVTTKGVGVGTGLGLSICYQIVREDHHGEILVESKVGKGTTFTVVLPMDLDETLEGT